MNTNRNLLEPLDLMDPPDQWDEIVERIGHRENRIDGTMTGSVSPLEIDTATVDRPSLGRRITLLVTAAAAVTVVMVGITYMGSRSADTHIVTGSGTSGTEKPTLPTESTIESPVESGLPACILNDQRTEGSTDDVLAAMSFTHAVGLISLIDRADTGEPSRDDVLRTLRAPYLIELATGVHAVSDAPEDSGLGTAHWVLEIDADGAITTRSFVVDSFEQSPDDIDPTLPTALTVASMDDPGGDPTVDLEPNPDCSTVIAAMRPVELTIAVAGPDIQYAAAVAYRIGNVLAGPR